MGVEGSMVQSYSTIFMLTCFSSVFCSLPPSYNHKVSSRDVKESLFDDVSDQRSALLMEDLLLSRGLVMKSCELQKHVLAKLRDLVVDSIGQVKICMEQEDKTEKEFRTAAYQHISSMSPPTEDVQMERLSRSPVGDKFESFKNSNWGSQFAY